MPLDLFSTLKLNNQFFFVKMKSYSSSMSEYYDAESSNNKDDRTSSDEESFTSEGEGEADSVTSETSDSKFGKLVVYVFF